MTSNKTIFFIIGFLLIVLGLFMLVPYGVQAFYKENSHSFLSSSLITILIGVIFVLGNLQEQYQLNLKQTFLFSRSVSKPKVGQKNVFSRSASNVLRDRKKKQEADHVFSWPFFLFKKGAQIQSWA